MFDVLRESKTSRKAPGIQEERSGEARGAPGPSPERCAPCWNAARHRNLERVSTSSPPQPGSCRPSTKLWQREESRGRGSGPQTQQQQQPAGTSLGTEELASRHFLRSQLTSCGGLPTTPPPPPISSSSPRLPGRTSHLSSAAPTPATHLTGIIISHDGTTILRGLKHERDKFEGFFFEWNPGFIPLIPFMTGNHK